VRLMDDDDSLGSHGVCSFSGICCSRRCWRSKGIV
jgi:hypothetical protein